MNRIGKYTAIKQLGAGGFGAVYLAEDKLGEQVAIKVFQIRDENLARQATSSSTDAVEVLKQRFMDEARTLRRLGTNPYIVEMYYFDELEDGTPYYVMPYLAKSLEQEIGKDAFTRGKLEETPPELHPRRVGLTQGLQWLEQILEALREVHNAGLVHRDIKPANILFNAKGQVQLCDFGIAKLPDAEHSQSGVGMGSRNYMSPEQRESAKHVGPQSDVYAVGVLAYRMLTGQLPSGKYDDPIKHVPAMGQALNDLIERAIAQTEDQRPQDGGEFLKQLRKARDGVDANAPEGSEATSTFTDVGQADDIRDELRPLKERIEQLLREKGVLDARDQEMLQTLADVVELDSDGLNALVEQATGELDPTTRALGNFVRKLDARSVSDKPLTEAEREGLMEAADAVGIEAEKAESLISARFATSKGKQRPGARASDKGARQTSGAGWLKAVAGIVVVAVLGGGGYWFYTEQQAAAERERVAEAQRIQAEAEAQAKAEAEQARQQQEIADRNARDDAAFGQAQSANTLASYRGYLKEWSDGRHRSEAESRIASLEQAAAAKRQAEEAARARKALIAATQTELNRLGYDVGAADGVLGAPTERAIRSFERWAKRKETGESSDSLLAALKAARSKPMPAVGDVFRDPLKSGGEGPEVVVLPTGSFKMGSNNGEDSERPVHTVTIGRPIAMMTTEVTWDQWERCVSSGGCNGSGPAGAGADEGFGKGNRPVINVDWNDAQAYARWLSDQTGKRYRLPSEAEWEYAARAGSTTEYSWGNEEGRNKAHCQGCESQWDNKRTAPVGSFSANAWGLHDMHGNVWEWVEDCYQAGYGGAPTDGSARGHCDWEYHYRVRRGGGWSYNPQYLRSAFRYGYTPSLRDRSSGFRLVQDLDSCCLAP
jgi:formylglycine-generating enzyme required for sulfatase activity/serine/threonine protein kinase